MMIHMIYAILCFIHSVPLIWMSFLQRNNKYLLNRIKHQGELVGKSTATHARILAPEDVTIHNYPVSWQKFHNLSCMLFIGKQGWHSGKRTRLPPLLRAAQIPALNPSVSLLLVLSFAQRGFIQVFRFSLLLKNSKFQFDQESGRWRTTKWMSYLFKSIIYYYYLLFFFFYFFYKTFLNKHIALDTDVLYLFHYVFYYKAVPEFQEKEQVLA